LAGGAFVGAPKPVSAATLYRRLEAEPSTLNPILATTDVEEIVLANFSRNLLDIDAHLNLIPGLCDHWTISPDQRHYALHLREEAAWEDGTPLTAHDLAVTLRLLTNPHVPASRYAPGLESLRSVTELDRQTIKVDFDHAYALRLFAFHVGLVPASRYEHHDILTAPENRAPIANGPYRVQAWRTGEEIVLVRNERYWGPRGAYDRIVFRVVPDQGQAYRALVRGELDETRLSAEQAHDTAQDPEFGRCCHLLQFPALSFLYVAYNHRNPLFHDPVTRRALTMLLDRQAMIDHLYGGAGHLISGPWPTALSAYDPTVQPYPLDPQVARALLERAGWRAHEGVLTRDGKPFRFHLLYTGTSATSREIAEIIQASLSGAGIACTPEAIDWPALNSRLATGEFDAAVLAFANDVNPDLFEEWHSSQVPPLGLNASGLTDATVDQLITISRAEGDPKQRVKLFHELHRRMHDLEAATWLFETVERHAVANHVDGVSVSSLGLFRFWPGAVAWSPRD
jgi:peptide/nickel transport system substrate-binding protein